MDDVFWEMAMSKRLSMESVSSLLAGGWHCGVVWEVGHKFAYRGLDMVVSMPLSPIGLAISRHDGALADDDAFWGVIGVLSAGGAKWNGVANALLFKRGQSNMGIKSLLAAGFPVNGVEGRMLLRGLCEGDRWHEALPLAMAMMGDKATRGDIPIAMAISGVLAGHLHGQREFVSELFGEMARKGIGFGVRMRNQKSGKSQTLSHILVKLIVLRSDIDNKETFEDVVGIEFLSKCVEDFASKVPGRLIAPLKKEMEDRIGWDCDGTLGKLLSTINGLEISRCVSVPTRKMGHRSSI